MSRKRKQKSANRTPIFRDDVGRTLCRHCKIPVTGKRKTFCSDDCVFQWKIRTSPAFARKAVFGRDKGFCAECGLDTEKLRKSLLKLSPADQEVRRIELKIPDHRTSFWDADHVVAVFEGGGECSLSNLRTLCIWCHRTRTSEQAKCR